MNGVIGILSNDAQVSARVGNKIYPLERHQKDGLPAVTVEVDSIDPSDSKDGVSDLDQSIVRVISFASSYDESLLLKNECRAALDRASGTYNSETIQSIQFVTESNDFERISNERICWWEQIYKVRIER